MPEKNSRKEKRYNTVQFESVRDFAFTVCSTEVRLNFSHKGSISK